MLPQCINIPQCRHFVAYPYVPYAYPTLAKASYILRNSRKQAGYTRLCILCSVVADKCFPMLYKSVHTTLKFCINSCTRCFHNSVVHVVSVLVYGSNHIFKVALQVEKDKLHSTEESVRQKENEVKKLKVRMVTLQMAASYIHTYLADSSTVIQLPKYYDYATCMGYLC